MGLFSWAFGGQKRFLNQKPDRVWLTRQDLWSLIPSMLQEPSPQKFLTLVVTHFPSSHRDICAGFRQADTLKVEQPSDWWAAFQAAGNNPSPIFLVPASVLKSVDRLSLPRGLDALRIVVCERHFLRERDDAIAAFGERFSVPGEIGFHLSLDDILLRLFVTDTIQNFLHANAGDSPWIESTMVSRSLVRAQAKFEEKVVSRVDTDSPEEWVAKNMRTD